MRKAYTNPLAGINCKKFYFLWSLFVANVTIFTLQAALTITPADSFYRVQVPYSARYQGIVIEPMPDQDPAMITIVAFKAKSPQDQGVQTGSAGLDTLVGQAITCNTASWLPWSSAEYHIHAYRTDPATKKRIKMLNARNVISIYTAVQQELTSVHKKARRLKKNIYAPLFLRSKITGVDIIIGIALSCLVVKLGFLSARVNEMWEKELKKKNDREKEFEVIMQEILSVKSLLAKQRKHTREQMVLIRKNKDLLPEDKQQKFADLDKERKEYQSSAVFQINNFVDKAALLMPNGTKTQFLRSLEETLDSI